MLFHLINFKRYIELGLLFPFILIGKIFRFINKRKEDEEFEIYFFFPFYHTGGAEDLHAKISNAIKNKSIIYFTKKSGNNRYHKEFKKSGHKIVDISKYTDNKLSYWNNLILRGIISQKINSQKKIPVIFNGQSNFGYKISPWIRKEIKQFDLIHALNSFSKIRIPYLKYYTKSVTVSQEIIDLHRKLYKKYSIDDEAFQNFISIHPGIKNQTPQPKDYFSETINILFVGRSSFEKRINLFGAIAKNTKQIEKNIHFIMAGSLQQDLKIEFHPYCTLLGNINNEESIKEIYNKCHILVVTSSSESGPLVSMEAMQMGLAVITTETGFVANYINDYVNGFKISPLLPEKDIVSFMTDKILYYYNNRNQLKLNGEENINLAKNNFTLEQFEKKYQALISNENYHSII